MTITHLTSLSQLNGILAKDKLTVRIFTHTIIIRFVLTGSGHRLPCNLVRSESPLRQREILTSNIPVLAAGVVPVMQ